MKVKIVRLDVYEVVLPSVHSFSTGFGTIHDKPELIIKLTTENGLIGYGEAATLSEPIYTAETVETCKIVLIQHIGPRILNKSFSSPEDFQSAYNDIVGNNLAKAGVESAFWDITAQAEKKSLKSLFGGVQNEIAVGESVGITDSAEALITNVAQLIEQGFVRIKVKIKPGWDREPLAAIRKEWPSINLCVDANASYTYPEHLELLLSLDEFNLSMFEQPFAPDDFVGHARLQSKLNTPICLDESIQSLNDAKTALELGSCKIINIKPGRVGGMLESIAIHDLAAEAGIGVWCGGMLETGVGRAFNIALASKANFRYPADMSPSGAYYTDDLTSPLLALNDHGCIEVRDTPGLGYIVDTDKLTKYTRDTLTLAL